MEPCSKLVLFSFALVVLSSRNNRAIQLSSGEEDAQVTFVTNLCKLTVDISKQALFHVLSMNSDFPIHSLVQNLHEYSIKTSLITSHFWLENWMMGQLTKNIIVFLNDLNEIPSLILDSASTSVGTAKNRVQKSHFPKLKHYCIDNDLIDFDTTYVNKTCDFKLHISRSELNGDSDLTDSLTKMTKGLYANSIWNSNNYIIFKLPLTYGKTSQNIYERQMKFIFKFFWRFFKGLRTIVCSDITCYNHDPLMSSIQQIDSAEEIYFNFHLSAPLGRVFQVGLIEESQVYVYGAETAPVVTDVMFLLKADLEAKLLLIINYTVITDVCTTVNCVTTRNTDPFEIAQKSNLDTVVFEASNFPLRDVAMFDFSAAIQSCSLCFATPRSGFVPQSLLPFKCFSLEVWTFILLAFLMIYAAFFIFHHSQWTRFDRLYSEREGRLFENTSVIFYLYSFLMVSSPSRLLLGRVITGKILFLVVSFFVLIIVTVLQSQLTTLLSKSLRYPDIDTLEELSNSNLFIQTPDLETSLERLQDYDFYDSLKNKLTEGHTYYFDILKDEIDEGMRVNSTEFLSAFYNSVLGNSSHLSPFLRRTLEIKSNLQSIMQSDAFEVSVFNLHQRYRANFYAALAPDVIAEFHLVKECVLTYPQTLIVQRNSYLSEFYTQKIIAYVEAGLAQYLTESLPPFIAAEDYSMDEFDEPLKAFTMQTLQPAFIALGLGLILSSFLFAFELSVDILKGSRLSMFARCIDRLVRPSSLWA